jgi:hypothetical protein
MKSTQRPRTAWLARGVVAVALAFASPLFAHGTDPLEHAPQAPAINAPVEQVSGEVRQVVVSDRASGASLHYRWLATPGGESLALRGTAADTLTAGSDVEITGRRNGKTLFVEATRALPPLPGKAARKSSGAAAVEGELRLIHVDYLPDSKSRFEFEVVDDAGEATPVDLGILPEALDRGMRVVVRGPARSDGTIEPDTIEIVALPKTSSTVRTLEKATVTNKALVILVRFTDSAASPFTQAQVQATFAGGAGSGSVTEYFKEVSYGQQLLSATVTPWLNATSATPAGCDYRAIGTAARNAATAAGYNLASYQNLVYVFPRISACGWSGLAYVGASGVWSNGYNSVLVYAHELGHNFGLLHAGSLDCGAASVGGTCTVAEYGDPFNAMGNQRAMHFTAAQKAKLGWVASAAVITHAGGSGTYTLSPLETPGGTKYAIKVAAASNRTYWLEYRQPLGFDAGLASYPSNGAQIRVASPFETLCSGCDSRSDDTQFIDTTPATAAFTDGALLVGRSFTDTKYGLTFNVLSATASGLTVQVVSGGGGGATTTTTALASSANPSALGAPVTFTATVTGSSPTGSVAFTANGATITGCGAAALGGSGNARVATCTTAALAAGGSSIVARYGGDAANLASTSATLAQTVNGGGSTTSTNVALASAGSVATASSSNSSSYPASAIINNERAGRKTAPAGWVWVDGTANAWPDWVQVRFAGSRTIDRVVVYTMQDNFNAPVEPTDTTTFSLYGLRAFEVQGWNGSAWVTLGSVTGNNLVKRTVTFPAFTTDRIRVNATSGLVNFSRITEVEAWSAGAASATTSASTSPAAPRTRGAAMPVAAAASSRVLDAVR